MELWDLYDINGNKTGETWERKRGNYVDIPEGRYHLVADILVIHKDGTFLLTKRDPRKDFLPGYWEPGAGGAAQQGEDPYECAVRELFEETGLKADSMELVGRYVSEYYHSLYYSYVATVSADKDSVVLQEGETTEYKWVDVEGFKEYLRSDLSMKDHIKRYGEYFEKLFAEI